MNKSKKRRGLLFALVIIAGVFLIVRPMIEAVNINWTLVIGIPVLLFTFYKYREYRAKLAIHRHYDAYYREKAKKTTV